MGRWFFITLHQSVVTLRLRARRGRSVDSAKVDRKLAEDGTQEVVADNLELAFDIR